MPVSKAGPGSLPIVCGVALCAFIALTILITPYARQPPAVDLQIDTWVSAHRTGGLTVLARILTWLGSAPVLVTVAAAAALWLWRLRQRARLAVIFAAAVVSTAGTVALIKIAVARHRPSSADLLGSPALDYSFPSGHTTNSAVVYVSLALAAGLTFEHRRRLLVGLLVLLAASIGWSRVYLGYHYPSDVVAGWLFATAVVAGVLAPMRTSERRRRSVTAAESTFHPPGHKMPPPVQHPSRSMTP